MIILPDGDMITPGSLESTEAGSVMAEISIPTLEKNPKFFLKRRCTVTGQLPTTDDWYR